MLFRSGTSDPAELELNGAAYVRIVAESESAGSGVERFTLNVPADVAGESAFDLAVELAVPGVHNARNAAAALTAAMLLGVEPEAAAKAVADFRGAARRFQVRGTVKQVTVVDDYAHHPTEIRATLTAAQKYPHKRLVLVFQPHTYSRTKAFLDDFADVLSMADLVVLADIYAAREQNTYGISSKDILEKLKEKGTDCFYFPSFSEIENFLSKNCINGDLLITMGAGDIVNVGEHLLMN